MTDQQPPETPPFDMEEFRRRQKSRSRIIGQALVALVVLIFFVTIAKMQLATP